MLISIIHHCDFYSFLHSCPIFLSAPSYLKDLVHRYCHPKDQHHYWSTYFTEYSNIKIMSSSTTSKSPNSTPNQSTTSNGETPRALTGLKHLFCGGVAGSVAKTVTAPLSRLTILYQVHSLVTTKENRPRYAMTMSTGITKIIERGGILSLWKGNGTSVLHRFPFSAINFYVYESMLDIMMGIHRPVENEDGDSSVNNGGQLPAYARLISGAIAGCTGCVACYPLDLVRTRLTTELEGKEHYKGITDAIQKIVRSEGIMGLYSGLGPTLFVAVPNFAISYTVYGSLKEYILDDDLFYNLRKIDSISGEESLGLRLTLLCGAASGTLSTLLTFPFDTIRRRMQIQNLHVSERERMSSVEQIRHLMRHEGVRGLYRGLTPELIKVIPMVGTMFTVYEYLKKQLNVDDKRG